MRLTEQELEFLAKIIIEIEDGDLSPYAQEQAIEDLVSKQYRLSIEDLISLDNYIAYKKIF